jgi:hypothetical protein
MAPNIDWIGSLFGIEINPNGTASKPLSLKGIGRQSLSHLTGNYLLQNKELKLDTNK